MIYERETTRCLMFENNITRYFYCAVKIAIQWYRYPVPVLVHYTINYTHECICTSILQVRYSCSGTHRYRYPGTCSTFNVALIPRPGISLLLNFTFYLLQNGPKRILARLIQIGSDCMYVPLLVSM